MMKSVKRERTEPEEPSLPLTPESNNGKGNRNYADSDESNKDASPSPFSQKKRVKQNGTSAKRSRVSFIKIILPITIRSNLF